jgi:hypothetical protein
MTWSSIKQCVGKIHDLGVVIAQLMLLDEMAFLKAIMDIERARQQIVSVVH